MLANLPSTYKKDELKAEEETRFQLKIKELSDARFRPLGSVAYRNGEKVLWAGQEWNYQSPGSFNELIDKGEIKIDEKYHGEIATDNALKTLSRTTGNISNDLEQHEWGRNLKGNLSNFAKGAGDVYDYLIDESERGGQSTTGEWGAWVLGSILSDREKYAKGAADLLSQLKIGGKGIDPRLLQIGTEEGIDALLTLGLSGVAGRVAKTATKLPPGPPTGNNALKSLVAAADTADGPGFYSGLPSPKPTNKPKIPKGVLEARKLLDEISTNGNVKKKTNHSTKVRNNPDLSKFKRKTGKGKSDDVTPKGKDIEIIYGEKGKTHPESGALSGNVDLHHEVGKDIRFDFTAQARKLDPKGQAALDDIDAEYGLQSGSGADALTPYNKIPHNRTHNSERRFLDTKDSFMSGNEPSGRFLHELRNAIAGASSLEELKKLYRDYIERSVLPFNEKARLFQRAYEKAGTPKTMTEEELKILAKLQKNQELSKGELMIERLMEEAYSKP